MKRLTSSITGIVAVIALALSVTGCGDDVRSARDFVTGKYTRATTLDQANDGRAYTSTLGPAAVTSAITGAARPLDNRKSGDRNYLQYRDDIITVSPNGTGSVVLVDQYRNGYTRHHSTVSQWGWPNTPPNDQYRSQSGK